MNVVDDVILARVTPPALTEFKVHDGVFTAAAPPGQPAVVSIPLPYAVFYSSIGDDDNRRLSSRERRRSVFFTFTYVGIDRRQAKWAGELIRGLILGDRFVVPGYNVWPTQLLESQRIRRDDHAVRPDGKPLFYGVDNYAVSVAPQSV